jgi:hypothetical protein
LQHPDKSQKHFCSSEHQHHCVLLLPFLGMTTFFLTKYFLKEKQKKRKHLIQVGGADLARFLKKKFLPLINQHKQKFFL